MKKLFLAGHGGMVGGAIYRKLLQAENVHVITKTRQELDLIDQKAVRTFLGNERPDEIILAAAKVGGIYANSTYPADFIYENLQVQINIIHAAHELGINKLLFLGSSCIYPKFAEQPISESALLTGLLEPTNEPYAVAKIAGIKMCEAYNKQFDRDFRSVMPTNLYGPGDNYSLDTSHVVPALIRRFHEAKQNGHEAVTIWGSGKPLREFLYVDDMADACLYIHNLEQSDFIDPQGNRLSHVNVGFGHDVSILSLAEIIKSTIRYEGDIIFDTSRPDGTPRKLLNTSLLNDLGWVPQTTLEEGLELTYQHFKKNITNMRM